MNKELKEKFKKLKRRKKAWMKHQKALQKVYDSECFWLNYLLEERLPYLRKYHAAYKWALRQLHKFPVSMGNTQGYLIDVERRVEKIDREILDVTLKEILKSDEVKDD